LLAALLPDRAERDTFAVGRGQAGLLGELALGGGQRLLGVVVLALDDRPGALLLARPQRPAHVPEQHLEAAVGPPEGDQSRAWRRHPRIVPDGSPPPRAVGPARRAPPRRRRQPPTAVPLPGRSMLPRTFEPRGPSNLHEVI